MILFPSWLFFSTEPAMFNVMWTLFIMVVGFGIILWRLEKILNLMEKKVKLELIKLTPEGEFR